MPPRHSAPGRQLPSRPAQAPAAFRSLGLALAIGALLPLQATAADVSLNAPGAPKALIKQMQKASLTFATQDDEDSGKQDLIAAAKADYKRMVATLYDNGYFSPDVSILIDGEQASSVNELTYDKPIGKIEIDVKTGPVFHFSQADVAPLPPGTLPAEGFTVGHTATTSIMSRAQSQALKAWKQSGNVLAKPESQKILANHADDTIAAEFRLAPGPKLTFGKVMLSKAAQSSGVRAERIREIAGIPVGETATPKDLQAAQRRLRNTGAFSTAVVTLADQPSAGNTIDSTINVKDAPGHGIGTGVEVSSTDGVTLTGYWLFRNMFHDAANLRFDGEVSGIGGDTGGTDYTFKTELTYPAFHHPDMNLVYGIEATREDEPSYLSDVAEASVGLERYINDKVTGTTTLGARYSRSDTGDGPTDFYHLTFATGITWDNRDNKTDPTRGAYAEAEVMPFLGVNGSKSGIRSTADIRGYYPVSDRMVLAGRLQLGEVMGPSVEDTPSDWLFYSGGGDTVRGQSYQSLGTVVDGDTTGGRSFSAISTELRAHVTDTIGVVAFADFGYVAASQTFEGGEWQSGAGIGARYFTSIGPIRLDFAVPTSGDDADQPFKHFSLYIGLGQAF